MTTHRFAAGPEVDALGSRDEIDAVDRRYASPLEDPEVHALRQAILARWDGRPSVRLGLGVYPALPLGVARLLHTARRLGLKKVWIEDDLDDLAGQWPGEVVPAERVDEADAVVLSIPGSPGWLERLSAHVAHGRRLFARLRAPHDAWWQKQCQGATVEYYRHDCEPYFVPGPMVLDGGGDHWLVRGVSPLDLSTLPRHGYRDFDGLDAARCDEAHLRVLMGRVAERLGVAPVLSSVLPAGSALSATLALGSGLTLHLELEPSGPHLLLTFAPYDPALETTAVSSVYEIMGTPHTRTRPLRATRTPTEVIV